MLVIVVGDDTNLLANWSDMTVLEDNECNSFLVTINVDKTPIRLHICSAKSDQTHEADEQSAQLMYPAADVFLVCFSVVSPTSFENVTTKWIPEIQRLAPNTPFFLVGTNIEKRKDKEIVNRLAQEKQSPITKNQGIQLALQLNALKYLECSEATKEGLKNLLIEAGRIALALKDKPENKDNCLLM